MYKIKHIHARQTDGAHHQLLVDEVNGWRQQQFCVELFVGTVPLQGDKQRAEQPLGECRMTLIQFIGMRLRSFLRFQRQHCHI